MSLKLGRIVWLLLALVVSASTERFAFGLLILIFRRIIFKSCRVVANRSAIGAGHQSPTSTFTRVTSGTTVTSTKCQFAAFESLFQQDLVSQVLDREFEQH